MAAVGETLRLLLEGSAPDGKTSFGSTPPSKDSHKPNFVMARQIALPPTLAPRLISRAAAAAYLSVSPAIFDELVKDGRMPRPKKLGERRLAWDVHAIDLAVDLLPVQGNDITDTTWSDVDDAT
jgi:predicted DNA-binding transcriptional regulator AlpA